MRIQFRELEDIKEVIIRTLKIGRFTLTPCTPLKDCIKLELGCKQCPYWKDKIYIDDGTHTDEQLTKAILSMKDTAILIYTLES